MNDIKQKMIDFLLANANPSIKSRIKSEILNRLSKEESDLYQKVNNAKKKLLIISLPTKKKMVGLVKGYMVELINPVNQFRKKVL